MKTTFKFIAQPGLEDPSLIVGWNRDAGRIAPKVIDFLNGKLGSQKFCEIEPDRFFPLGGVSVEDDCIQFPESSFFYVQTRDLVIFKSDQPAYDHYAFLNSVLDVPERYGKVKELYTISGMVSHVAHTTPRRIFTVFNQPEFQESLQSYNLEGLTWEGPPAISSFLLWIARRRGIHGLSLWLEVPFYLAASEDLWAIRFTLSFLDQRFNLNLDLQELDIKIREQNEKIDRLRDENAEVNRCIGLLESGFSLKEEVQLKLAQEIHEHLKRDM
ncbi:MAG: PAC2 family protein [Thermodesulfovibrionales bacterium]|nr:PAC2 family protein [Thermodesulfovibrionales bacterium]